MVKTLLVLLKSSKTAMAELGGAALIVYGVAQWSSAAAFVVGGLGVLAKSMEWDLARRSEADE